MCQSVFDLPFLHFSTVISCVSAVEFPVGNPGLWM